MRHRWIVSLGIAAAAAAQLFVIQGSSGIAQIRAPQATGPALPAPRLADGTPNLGPVEPNKGYWVPKQYQDYVAVLKDAKEIPYQPWSKALSDSRKATASKYDPQGYCLPPVGTRLMTTPYPMEILQMPEQKRIVMIYEGGAHLWRMIYMDGRAHPTGDALAPTWMGHSVGHWDGDTLVVDVVGFNEGSWIDMVGDPHTSQFHLVERFTRTNMRTLHYEGTIDDPGAYTKPWTVQFDIAWDPNGEIQEYICQENNRWQDSLMESEKKANYAK